MPADKLDLHPGPSGEYTVVRYTAPAAGTYSVVGQFVGLDSATTNVFVVLNNTFIFTGTINGAGSTAPFNFTMPLIAGDVLDFAVGWGVNHNYTSDSTGLQGTITTVPTVLALSQSRPIFLFPRQTFSLSASKLDANGQPVPANVTWSTSNPGIATVSGSGLVTANSTGAVRITATDTASQQTATVLVHVSGDFFFWSTSASEIANFASPFWHSDGNVFGIYPNNANLPAQIPLYRFYDPGSGTHFWTTDVNGELFTQQPGVIFEGNIAFVFSSQQPGTVPVYRWFSGATNTHFWTTDPNGEGIPRPEYQSEGAVFYAYPAGSGPAQMLRVHCASCVL
jgi:hypothetical protein